VSSRTPPAEPSASQAAPPAVSLEHVSVEFASRDSTRPVLNDLSLELAAGEFVALVGRSGCGKTTVLNLVAGLIHPAAGTLSVLGTTPRRARPSLGYMFARDALFPWRTALSNVEIGLELKNVPASVRREKAAALLKRLGLEAAADKIPAHLSHGMRQRVALARTWATDPMLLLMDEPFAALDAQTREVVRAEFLEFWESSRRTVLFVTHDLDEALLLADRVILLGDGDIRREVVVPFERPRLIESLEKNEAFIAMREDLRKYLA
jgi:NitT/TauT family transport system ATP-binding protein